MAKDSIEYNLDSFIAEQKQLGRGDDELKEFIGKRFGDKAVKLHFDKSEEKTAENPVTEFFKQIPSEVLIPGVAALAGGAGVGAGYAFKSLKDRMAESKGAPPRIDPLMDVNQRPPTGRIEPDFNKPAPSVVQITKDPIEQRLFEISQAQQAAKTQPPMMGQPGFQPSAPVAPPSVQSLDQAFAASIAPPVVQTAPAASVPPPETETKKTGGRPPKQAIAPDEEKLTKGQQAMKKHLISMYGDGAEALSAYSKVKDILGYTPEFPPGKGGSLQPEEKEKILQYRKENIAGPKINLTHEMKKTMKAGGGIAALMAIPGFANESSLKEVMGNIGEALLPMGMTPSELAPGTLTEKQFQAYKEAQKLGSPYRSVPPR
jgi:hypothetical protein